MKVTRNIFSIALSVVLIIVIILIFNPFNLKCHLFSQCKLTIYETGVQIQAINEIGQFLTSQYIGETHCSDNIQYDSKEEWFNDQKASIKYLYENLREAIEDIFINEEIDKYKQCRDILKSQYPQLYGHKYYNLLVKDCSEKTFLGIRQEIAGLEEIAKSYAFKGLKKKEKNVNYYCGDRCVNSINELLEKYEAEKDQTKLIYLARGTINAGFNLGKIEHKSNENPSDIVLVKDTLIIKNLKVEILDSIINPWFIPGKVKGFELFHAEGKTADYDKIALVKQRCKLRLKNDAIRNGIKLDALANAESSLKSLFNLNTNKEIKSVVIKSVDPIDLFEESILNDKKIDAYEMNKLIAFVKKYNPEKGFDNIRYRTKKEQLIKLENLVNKVNKGVPVEKQRLTVEYILQK